MEDEKIFDRVEKKYLITPTIRRVLLRTIKKNMKPDSYFKSNIYNIYFDTNNYDLITQSIDHPIFKEKFRARSYDGYDKVFLEIKTKLLGSALRRDVLENDGITKDNNIGYKRRILINKQDFEDLIKGKATALDLAKRNIETRNDIQIAKEIDYFMSHFKLKPKILLYYDRESYIGDNDLRITFDENLKYRNKQLKFVKKSLDKTFFKDDKNIIMEIKAKSALPLWLVKVLSTEHIYPQRFSKIDKIYERIYNTNERRK